MKMLTLTGELQRRLSRLSSGVDRLYFDGIDPHNLASKVCVAIVGSRKMTPYGREMTHNIAADLAREGVVVVSGHAFGVDITAHRAVLEEGSITVAVLASDVKNVYPAAHRQTASDIIRGGGVMVSEYADNPYPRKDQFLARNRIIAALSDAVIVPEAAHRSGALNTAWHAEQMGIPVFAVPGRVTDPLSSGTNRLIGERRAQLITSAQDVLRVIGAPKQSKADRKRTQNLTKAEQAILDVISSGIHDTTSIQLELNLTTTDLQTTLTMLEINGRICQNTLGEWTIAV